MGRGEGLVLHDHAFGGDAVFDQPLRHTPGLRSSLVFGCRTAACTNDQRVRIPLRAAQRDRKALDQLVAHGPVRGELEAQNDKAQLVGIGKIGSRLIVVDRQRRVGALPQLHDALPARGGVLVRGFHFLQKHLDFLIGLFAVAAVIDDHLLDDLLRAPLCRFLSAAGAQKHRKHKQEKQGNSKLLFHDTTSQKRTGICIRPRP